MLEPHLQTMILSFIKVQSQGRTGKRPLKSRMAYARIVGLPSIQSKNFPLLSLETERKIDHKAVKMNLMVSLQPMKRGKELEFFFAVLLKRRQLCHSVDFLTRLCLVWQGQGVQLFFALLGRRSSSTDCYCISPLHLIGLSSSKGWKRTSFKLKPVFSACCMFNVCCRQLESCWWATRTKLLKKM